MILAANDMVHSAREESLFIGDLRRFRDGVGTRMNVRFVIETQSILTLYVRSDVSCPMTCGRFRRQAFDANIPHASHDERETLVSEYRLTWERVRRFHQSSRPS